MSKQSIWGPTIIMGLVGSLICAFAWVDTAARPPRAAAAPTYDPLADARASLGVVGNREATVPPQCYTATDGTSNPCWTCHTDSVYPNQMEDVALQEEYAFSDQAMTNHWGNLFEDRTAAAAAFGDDETLAYVRTDNYTPLREALAAAADYPGYRPDLDFGLGFDRAGFARDGSGWRAFRYKPFPGIFWPTNGNTDDVMMRLPEAFRSLSGSAMREVYRINLAIVEATVAAGPEAGDGAAFSYPVEPLDESVAGRDLDGDGRIGTARRLAPLPTHFVGDAAAVAVVRYLYPKGTELLHSVRYLDPDAPGMIAVRMKELRYMRKIAMLDAWALNHRYEEEYDEKEAGIMPWFAGDPLVGLRNGFGWQLQGFIENADGLLRLQTHEEHQACMGCHGALGVTVDQTFALARKLPGAAGWRYQDLRGMQDVPQQGHTMPEVATYLARVGGADPFRANTEMPARFLAPAGGTPAEDVSRAAPGGDRDLAWLLLPSRERALALDKAYRAMVVRQRFNQGRDVMLAPPVNVHRRIENGDTNLARTGRIFGDGRAWLSWGDAAP